MIFINNNDTILRMELDFTSVNKAYNKYEKTFNEILSFVLKFLKLKFSPIVSVSIIDNEAIHQINKEYRNIDRETDVISFAFIDSEKDKDKIKMSKIDYVLGDIYISYEKCEEQAKSYEHSLNREICFLFLHGILHLLGYDHMEKDDEKIMFDLQDKILNEMGITR